MTSDYLFLCNILPGTERGFPGKNVDVFLGGVQIIVEIKLHNRKVMAGKLHFLK